jgi:ribonuclease HII
MSERPFFISPLGQRREGYVPDFALEDELGGTVAGVDEVGRGPLAGPVVAAAVILDRTRLPREVAELIQDSKRLSAAQRQAALAAFRPYAQIALGAASVAEIGRLNILGATFLAMARAVARLDLRPEAILVDGRHLPPSSLLPQPVFMRAVVRGDGRSLSIAAASIAAKLIRDLAMAKLAIRHPAYGWERNAGYPTREHREALARVGVTSHHRMSFKPLQPFLVGVTDH